MTGISCLKLEEPVDLLPSSEPGTTGIPREATTMVEVDLVDLMDQMELEFTPFLTMPEVPVEEELISIDSMVDKEEVDKED